MILTASILIWFLTNYPANVEYSKDYEEAKASINEKYDGESAKALLEKLDKEKASEKMALSYAGQFGHAVEPMIKPLGFDWKMGVGLVSAVAAKEVLVSSLATIYSVGNVEEDSQSLQEALTPDPTFSPLVALSLMVFTLLYSPCLAVLAVIRRETNSWKWPAFSFAYSTVLAWIMAFLVYQGGTALGY